MSSSAAAFFRSFAVQRVLLVGTCGVLAALCVLSGIDRAGASDPALARRVPASFAAASLNARGMALIAGQRYSEAALLAEQAVRAGPVEPEASALLGAARLGLQDQAGAEKAFLVAAQFGWRTPITQYYWMDRALQVGDYRVATLRLDALLRQQPALVAEQGLLAPIESSPAGQAELANRLGGNPVWLKPYAETLAGLTPELLMRRADVLHRLAQNGAPLGCATAGRLATALISAGNILRAKGVWDSHCSHDSGLISDPTFARLQGHSADSPFDWVLVGDSDVSVSLGAGPDGKGRRLQIASSASFPRKILIQMAIFPPGPYRLSWRAEGAGPKEGRRISATVSCQPDSREWLTAREDRINHRYMADFTADSACAGRWIGFAIQPGSEPVSLGDIALQPLR